MITMPEYVALRDEYKGHGAGTKFRKLIGRYDPNRGTLENLNEQVSVYIRSGGPAAPTALHVKNLNLVHDAIVRSPKVEKYGTFLAEVLLRIPSRPEKPVTASAAKPVWIEDPLDPEGRFIKITALPAERELFAAMVEAQQESAYHMFVEGSYASGMGRSLTPPTVTWKKGAIVSTRDAIKAWKEAGATIVKEVAQENRDNGQLGALANQVQNVPAMQAAGQTVIAGGKVAPPKKANDLGSSIARRGVGMTVDAIDGSPDIYELAAAGSSGFSDAKGFGLDDIGSGDLQERLQILNDPSIGLDQETVDYFTSAVGFGFSCLGLVSGMANEVKAAFTAYNANKLKTTYEVVPFGNATAAVGGIRDLLNRYAAELAVLGAANIVGGATSLAGLGPIGGIATMGVKILIQVGLALRDAEEAKKARLYLEEGPRWKDKSFVMKAMSEVPLFAAYYVMSASTSDLVGFLSNPHAFSRATFLNDVEQVKPQITFLRNMANTCQMNSTWGLAPMTGWMQCLDTRWYVQPKKEAYNMLQEFKRADKVAMGGRVQRLKARFERTQ